MLAFMAITAAGCLILLVCVLLIYSPGKLTPYRDPQGNILPGSLAEKIFLNIGGVKQGMFIKSKDINNPVLLYVHGGPIFPNYFLIDKFDPGLEDHFTVCYWEQRGGGLSYSPEVSLASMTFDQLTSDAIEVTNYLRSRFGKESIYVMSHSGGSPIALQATSRNPKLFTAYIGMAQITNQAESEKIAYSWMLDQYTKQGNQKRINQFHAYPVLESDSALLSFYKSNLRDQAMHELGIGTMHQMKSVFWDIFIPVWTCKAYTITEKINIWKSKFSFRPKTNLLREIITTDYTSTITKLDMPVYFLSGKFDLTVNIDLSKAYLSKLQAPLKGFYTFAHSAHSPLFEEQAAVMNVITTDVLRSDNRLSDNP